MSSQTPVFINLLAIARYDHMPDYPIQFMTVGNLSYANPEEALLQYVESQQDEETGQILKSDISLSLHDGRITMERKGEFANTMVFGVVLTKMVYLRCETILFMVWLTRKEKSKFLYNMIVIL